ncbi:MAG: hypothetical protein KatS3mg027_2426 [Bacteroidia bacterium]|nr:MAG: hypothetical protein KatS3mg027_2426 [Bacteroidia bacterium]
MNNLGQIFHVENFLVKDEGKNTILTFALPKFGRVLDFIIF